MGHVTYFFKFWNPSKTVSQTIKNSKYLGPWCTKLCNSRSEKTIRTVCIVV